MRIPRKRFIQLCVRSTTQRRALRRARRLSRWASAPLAGMWAVKPNSWTVARTSADAYPLSRHRFCSFSSVTSGRGTGMLSNVSSTIFRSGRLAPSTASPIGMPWPSTSRLRLVPCLARSVGFLPVFFPPEGRLGHAPVHAQPLPVDAFAVVVGHQADLPHLLEDAGLH